MRTGLLWWCGLLVIPNIASCGGERPEFGRAVDSGSDSDDHDAGQIAPQDSSVDPDEDGGSGLDIDATTPSNETSTSNVTEGDPSANSTLPSETIDAATADAADVDPTDIVSDSDEGSSSGEPGASSDLATSDSMSSPTSAETTSTQDSESAVNTTSTETSSATNSQATTTAQTSTAETTTSSPGDASEEECGGEGQRCCEPEPGSCDEGLECDNPIGLGLDNSVCKQPEEASDAGTGESDVYWAQEVWKGHVLPIGTSGVVTIDDGVVCVTGNETGTVGLQYNVNQEEGEEPELYTPDGNDMGITLNIISENGGDVRFTAGGTEYCAAAVQGGDQFYFWYWNMYSDCATNSVDYDGETPFESISIVRTVAGAYELCIDEFRVGEL